MANIKGMLGKRATNLSDKTIANDTMAAKAAGSSAYLAAAMTASTPELKQLFSSYSTQMFGEHAELSALNINKAWMDPYNQPEKMLLETLNHSKEVLGSHVTE